MLRLNLKYLSFYNKPGSEETDLSPRNSRSGMSKYRGCIFAGPSVGYGFRWLQEKADRSGLSIKDINVFESLRSRSVVEEIP